MIDKEDKRIIEIEIREYQMLLKTIEQLNSRIKELEEINKEHQKLNGELRKENNNLTEQLENNIKELNEKDIALRTVLHENDRLKEDLKGRSIQEMGMSDIYKED